jgi:hypothetical protein
MHLLIWFLRKPSIGVSQFLFFEKQPEALKLPRSRSAQLFILATTSAPLKTLILKNQICNVENIRSLCRGKFLHSAPVQKPTSHTTSWISRY